jgi:hypothetical protein
METAVLLPPIRGQAVRHYSVTLSALALKPSGFCKVRVLMTPDKQRRIRYGLSRMRRRDRLWAIVRKEKHRLQP